MSDAIVKRAAGPVVADIALLLEGTFPYVSGGVSSWVNQILRSFPEYRYAIVFIGGRRADYGKPVYALPSNVVHFEEHYIHEVLPDAPVLRSTGGGHPAFARMAELHDALKADRSRGAIAQLMRDIMPFLGDGCPLSEKQFLHSRASWEFITERYEQACTDPSFTDYFWTVRLMHRPIWQLVRIAENLPHVRMCHTASTGYAGFLGAMARFRNGTPLLISEHGIYTKERKIDLLQSRWIRDNRSVFEKDVSQIGYLQDLWVRFFEAMSKICYEAADPIVSLYEGNRARQISDGAPPEKTRVIPNGIVIDRFKALREQRPQRAPGVVALIGRVVPIKDIKTFIRAIFIARKSMPALEGWVVGPEDEDPAYAQECHELVAALGLQDKLRFLGFRAIEDLLPQVGLVALSSVSEGLPLVVLEAFAAGVPVVTTDVGSCGELVYGRNEADKALGAAGATVGIANPKEFAQAVLQLLEQPPLWEAAQQAGMIRVERYYADTIMKASYREVYEGLMDGSYHHSGDEELWRA